MKAILHLTSACNLRCTYCYAKKQDVNAVMTSEIAHAAVDLVASQPFSGFCISFFGGEPLLQFPLIRTTVDYARKQANIQGKRLALRMSTNGLLLTPEILHYCQEQEIILAISCDGNQSSHDASRRFPDGRGSFEELSAILPAILVICPSTVFASVITPVNCHALMDSLIWMWDQGIRNIAHEPDFSDSSWDMDTFEELTRQMDHLCDWYLATMRKREPFFLSLLENRIKSGIVNEHRENPPCDFGMEKISIAPDGTIYPCVRFVGTSKDFSIGHVFAGFSETREKLANLNRSEKPSCEDCDYLHRCIQYCGCNNFTSTGAINRVHPLVCEHERMLLPRCDALARTLWQEGNPLFLSRYGLFSRNQDG